jgi:predicted hydrocarbon binding protein
VPEMRVNRNLPARMSWLLLKALVKEISDYSLKSMLEQTGIGTLNELSVRIEGGMGLSSDEFARLLASVREYYGSGARGILTRVGRTAWNELAHQSGIGLGGKGLVGRIMLRKRVARQVLRILARELSGKTGEITIHLLDLDLYLVDRTSDTTYGQHADEPICFTTIGMIQEALSWGTGVAYDVEETACMAAGADTCKFRIRS